MQRQGEKKTQVQTKLVESEDAVFELLESLLEEVDETTAVQAETASEPSPAVSADLLPPEPLLETTAETSVEVEEQQVTEQQVECKAEQAFTEGTQVQSENVKIFEQLPLEIQERLINQATEELRIKNSLPDWAGQPLPCLLVEVENFELAVPLILLNGISVWDQPTLPMPTQPDWHLGVIEYRGENVVMVDTARLIMADKLSQSVEQRRLNHPSHFLRVGSNMALSCDAIRETLSLNQDEIRWRIQRTTRPWAVGTLIDRLCILLDAEVLLQEIETN